MTEADLDCVCKIEQQEPSPWKEPAIRAELFLEQAVQLVGRIETEVIGWVCCRYTGAEAELLKIAVIKKYRRVGVASFMFDRMASQLEQHNVNMLFLEVRSRNHTAVKFYQNKGFTEVGRRTNYYRQPQDDALILKMNHFEKQRKEENEKCPRF